MFAESLRRVNWLTGGLHVIIVFFALQVDERVGWMVALAAMAVLSVFAWAGNYRRYRQITDLPTSRVASAPQGYVELMGTAREVPGTPLASPLSATPCCWYRYLVERQDSDNKWHTEDSGESNDHFLLDDGTGECVVSPEGAEVVVEKYRTWQEGSHRYSEWLLLPRLQVYALGEFQTVGGAASELDEKQDIAELLAAWKTDPKTLHARFDLDRNGQIDLREWELARRQARREVEREHAEIRSRDGVNLLRKPADGRLFLLSDQGPARLTRHYAKWSFIHLVIALIAGTASAAMALSNLL